MDLVTEQQDDVMVITLKAEVLDANNAKVFKEKVASVLEGGNKVVLRLDHVNFIDSSGCGALLSCLRKINTNDGILKFAGVQKPVRALFELIRLNRIVDMYNTLEDAVDAF